MKFPFSENNIRKLETIVPPQAWPEPACPEPSGPEPASPEPEGPSLRDVLAALRRRIRPDVVRRIAACLFLAGALWALLAAIFEVSPVFTETALELGTPVSRDLSDYLDAGFVAAGFASLDLSEVDETRPGDYHATVSYFRNAFDYRIEIRDTRAPVAVLRSGPFVFSPGDTPDPSSFVLQVRDADPDITCRFDPDLCPDGSYVCKDPGEYSVPLLVSDSSGNTARTLVTLLVDLPPEILGVRDVWVTPEAGRTQAIDFTSEITVADETDGDLTPQLEADASAVLLSEPGDYPVFYSASDHYGLRTESACTVHVCDADRLQQLIGNRTVNHLSARIYGALNPYDTGARKGLTMEETLRECAPALVQLYHSSGHSGYACGSGFLSEITPEGVYVCTNAHVLEDFSGWSVYFSDGTRGDGFVLGTSEEYDVGVVFVPAGRLPEGYEGRLSTVHIDRSYWESLENAPEEGSLSLGLAHISLSGEVEYTSTGTLVQVHQRFSYFQRNDQTEITVQLIHGDSGSAILDEAGNLIGIGFAYSLEPEIRYWAVPLDAFLQCYEEITGRLPYLY